MIAGGLAIRWKATRPAGRDHHVGIRADVICGPRFFIAVWLLSGGTLVLHHPFDEEVLETQINEYACDTLIAPAPLALRLDELDLAGRLPSLRNVIGLWRAPERSLQARPGRRRRRR